TIIMNKIIFPLLILIGLGIGVNSYSQESYGGLPISYTNKTLTTDIDQIMLEQPNMKLIIEEDAETEKNGGMRRVGYIIPVKYNMNNAGTWETLKDGTQIWRLKITCPEALSLVMLYEEFYLPQGSQLFLYNENRKQLLGAYNHRTNPKLNREFSTQMIQGETTYIEYVQPKNVTENAILNIEGVVYNYRDVEQFVGYYDTQKNTSFGSSGNCNVNVNCPEGATWQTQKKGIAVIYVIEGNGAGFCSGTLVNNTANNGIPYMLTADHCVDVQANARYAQWQFHFNFEATACTNPTSAPSVTNSTVTGCTYRSNGSVNGGTDFLLLELSSTEATLAGMNLYYNGWDRSSTASTSGVCIHHPGGDIKKISTYTATLQTGTFNNSTSNGCWRANWVQTQTNWGITEGGSSGSPLFNANKLVVGTLSGGASSCGVSAAQAYDLYGKFNLHWESNGTADNKRLKPWLDPINSGAENCPGYNPNAGGGDGAPVANFTGTPQTVTTGGTVNFTDMSTNTPTSWSWTFAGGTPATSTAQNPAVVYNTIGTYTVTLTATNANGSHTETKTNYITVRSADGCGDDLVAQFVASSYEITAGECINFEDQSEGVPNAWSWSFPGASPTISTSTSPHNICYNEPGTYDVILEIRCSEFQDVYTCVNCITVLPDPESPVADFDADYTVVPVGGVVNFTNISQNGPHDQWAWTFEGGTPSSSNLETPPIIAYSTVGTFDVSLRCRKADNRRQDVELKENYIKVVPLASTAPTADFAANYTVISPNESINFIDFSSGTPHRWNWTFEGGTPASSTRQHPTEIKYARAGVYRVKLTVSNNIGSDTLTKEAYILVTTQDTCMYPPQANFSARNRLIEPGGEVYFQNTSTGNPHYTMWEFPGGTPSFSTEQTPSNPIVYNTPGIYKAKLTVSNNCGVTEFTKNKYIYVFTGFVSRYCDTISTVKSGETYAPKEHPTPYYGYISGHSGKKIKYFANYFEYYTFTEIEALILPVYQAVAGAYSSYVEFCIWEPNGRRPADTPIARKKVFIRDLSANQNNIIRFDEPVQIEGPFYAGFRINYPDENNDNISDDLFVAGMVTNRGGNDTTTNTAFFLKSGEWKTTNELYGFSSSFVIKPVSCLVDVPNFDINNNSIEIFPNPTTGQFSIVIGEDNTKVTSIEVYDALGRKHDIKYANTETNEYLLNMNNYPKGMYLIKIISGDSVVTKKVLLTN
ncbi:PKD domain-containing protein, partial [Bacteroidales bacterium OttesenSCG-928-I21]|nr:PKD domain-containing protein [Bacteroidales bacterium OttesenSCG-928-I21]